MIQYRRIAFTVYCVTNMAKARKFYEGVLGLKSNGMKSPSGGNWVEYDIGQGTLALGCSPDWKPSRTGSSAALEVVDFDAALAHLKKEKIKPAIGPVDSPLCLMVGIRDPDGNMIALHSR